MDVHIREQPLPGIGRRYEVQLGDGRYLAIIVARGGEREISIGTDHDDEPAASAPLEPAQAIAVAAILTGARFSIDTTEDREVEPDAVVVETVTLGARSPAIGHVAADVPLLHDCDASVLAVIRDDTPELIEAAADRPCREGDRVVIAARAERLAEVVRDLAG